MNRVREFSELGNVGQLLAKTSALDPEGVAVVTCHGRGPEGKFLYRQCSFAELDRDSDRIAAGLVEMGYRPGERVCLMVPPGIDFISLVFACFKARLVAVLIDPGMGRANLIDCLAAVEPAGLCHYCQGTYRAIDLPPSVSAGPQECLCGRLVSVLPEPEIAEASQ